MRISILLLLVFVTVLSSCSKKEDTGALPEATSGYKTISVTNGGSIKGIVQLSTAIGSIGDIETQKDQDVCGTSHKNSAAPGNGSGIAGCVVYLEKISQGKAFSVTNAQLDQHGCEFKPHIQILPVGAPLTVINSDGVVHNYHITKEGATILNEAQPQGAPPHEVKVEAKGIVSIGCDVHPWMKGFLFLAENPYAAITDTSGSFSLTDIPPGDYTLVIWRDNWLLDQQKDAEGRITAYKWGPDLMKREQVHIEAGKEIQLTEKLP